MGLGEGSGKASLGECWSTDPDLSNRDPNNINDHLTISFEEIFGEPDHTQSLDCVWRLSYKCFNLWKTLTYYLATTLYGICIAMGWGCEFAEVAFWHIWVVTPYIRWYEVQVKICGKVWSLLIHTYCDPCCEAFGKIFEAFKK